MSRAGFFEAGVQTRSRSRQSHGRGHGYALPPVVRIPPLLGVRRASETGPEHARFSTTVSPTTTRPGCLQLTEFVRRGIGLPSLVNDAYSSHIGGYVRALQSRNVFWDLALHGRTPDVKPSVSPAPDLSMPYTWRRQSPPWAIAKLPCMPWLTMKRPTYRRYSAS